MFKSMQVDKLQQKHWVTTHNHSDGGFDVFKPLKTTQIKGLEVFKPTQVDKLQQKLGGTLKTTQMEGLKCLNHSKPLRLKVWRCLIDASKQATTKT